MSRRPWWKAELAVIVVVLLAVAGWLLIRVPEIVAGINRKHPDLGIVGWSMAVAWLAGCLVLIEVVTRRCRKKQWSRFCYSEGTAAGALFLFLSSVLYLLLAAKP